ncbi:MAG: DNA topoisomerase [Clostridia bacterium]|nr:DNA topoisomerase [Clostridia bacterium]
MGKKVIIAEKPSVAKEFARVLNINGRNNNGFIESDEYIVTWCVGHLVTMSYPEKYDEKLKNWNLNTLPFIPQEYQYEVIDSVAKQFEIIKNILNREEVDCIYVCTDSGREGEYIYRLVDDMAGKPQKAKKRVWIDSQTEEAILNGIKEAKNLSEYDSLSDSAYLRAKEDYLIGINFSRLLSLAYGKEVANKVNENKAVISIGRVMTCVLGMIVAREREIRDFKKQNFYKIQGKFGENEENSFIGEWKVNVKSKVFESPLLYSENGFKKENDATSFIAYIQGLNKQAIVEEVSKKTTKEKAPLLFNLAEIQNECSKRFKISPDETLQNIQNLYEKKLVTYPRTDARVLSSAVAKVIGKNLNGLFKSNIDETIKASLNQMVTEKYSTKLEKTKYVDDSKITDHYAIIPTGQGFENYNKLNELERNIYHLIVKRFIAIFYPPAEYSKMAITLNIGNELFYANGRVCTKQGYLDVYQDDVQKYKIENKENSEEKEENTEKLNNIELLAKLKKGQEINLVTLFTKEGETTPPKRYSSGSIILAMENAGKLIEDETLREQMKGSGIGTSATRAEIIKKLERIRYIDSNKKTQILTPTNKGEVIFDVVNKTMPDLLNPELTASWEKGLTMVAQKEIKADEFEQKLNSYIRTKVVKYKKVRNEYLYGY